MKKIKVDNLNIFILSIIAFWYTFGLDKLNPKNISWLFEARADWATHYLGWAFYRDSNWQFPLGRVDNYYYPIGTNIGFTDSIPLFALPFKVFSFLLPQDFQYIGLWLLLCMFLNGFYSFKILQYFKVNKIISYLFVIIIILNPVFIFRQVHPSYCAHWLIIGSIYLYLTTDNTIEDFKSKINHQLVLLFLSCFITVYLTVVVLGFFALLLFKLFFYEKLIKLIKGVAYFVVGLFITFASWTLIGLIDFSKSTEIASTGFYGIYKMNLNSLYNPLGFSKILPSHELVTGYQQDAIMYLGLGMILMILITVGFTLVNFLRFKKIRFNRKLIPLLVFSFFLTVFATTNVVSFNDKNIFTIPFLEKMSAIGDIFRASGRFFWTVYYLILFYFIKLFVRIPLNKMYQIGLVAVFLVIQLIDLNPMFIKKEHQLGEYKPKLNLNLWNGLFSNFKNIVTVMPFNNDLVNFQDYQEIAYFAYKNKNTVTVGNLARYDGEKANKFTNDLIADIIQGNFSKDNLFVTNKGNLKYFSEAYEKNLIKIINSDGYYFIYPKSKNISNLPNNTAKDKEEFEIAKSQNLKTDGFELSNSPLPKSSGEVKMNIENELINNAICQIKGWAFIENSNNNVGDSIFIYLKSDKYLYKKACVQTERKDITIVFKKENLDNSGFENFAFLNSIEKGKYNLIIAIKDKKGDLYFSDFNKIINIGLDEITTPTKLINNIPQNQNIGHGVDLFNYSNHVLSIKGWAAYKEFDSKESKIEVLLMNNQKFYCETTSNIRKDVTEALKNKINYDLSGFEAKINTKTLPKGNYQIGIRVTNGPNNKDSYILTDKKIFINQ